MNLKPLLLSAVALVSLASAAPLAHAQGAMPYGVWAGRASDGSQSMSLVINGNNTGGFTVSDAQGRPVVVGTGTWSFDATSTGGILTLTYFYYGSYHHVYFSVTNLGPGRILLSDPVSGTRILLTRQ